MSPRPVSPHIDRLAAEGVLFERCYSAASWTNPAFTSMFTGLSPEVHGCTHGGSGLSKRIPTLPEHFHRAGYFCAGVISNKNIGSKFGFGRGFDLYDDYTVFLEMDLTNLGGEVRPELNFSLRDLVTGGAVTRRTKQVMSQIKKRGKPFFLFIVYFDPHFDYVPPAPFDKKFDPGYKGSMDGRGIQAMQDHPPQGADLHHLVALYDGEIAYEDAQVGELVHALDEISPPGKTLTILVSDHGEAFGEHQKMTHGHSAYGEEIAVPMIWRWPGVLPKGLRVKEPVCSMDIAKTLLELIPSHALGRVQGRSLWPALRGGHMPSRQPVLSQRAYGGGHQVALTIGSRRLHARFAQSPADDDARFELYDISDDPWEQRDIMRYHPVEQKKMTNVLCAMWLEGTTLRAHYLQGTENPQVTLTDEERRQLEGLGYVQGSTQQHP